MRCSEFIPAAGERYDLMSGVSREHIDGDGLRAISTKKLGALLGRAKEQ